MTTFRSLLVGLAASLAALSTGVAQTAAAPPAHKLSATDIKAAAAAIAQKGVPVAPCACIKDFVDHCKKTTPSSSKWYYLTYTLAITSNNGIVLYSEGMLTWDGTANRLVGCSTNGYVEYFNGSRDAAGNPFHFNPNQSKVKFSINANCNAVVVHGNSAPLTVPLLCNNNILYGFLPAHGDAYMVSLVKREMDIPR